MTELEKARKIINETDRQMAELFVKRMTAVKEVAEYKRLHGMQVFDPQREQEVLDHNSAMFKKEELRQYNVSF